MRQRILDIPAGSVTTPILASLLCRRCVIVESALTAAGAPNTPSGITYALPGDGFTQYFALGAPSAASAGTEPNAINIGDSTGLQGPYGAVIGNGPGVQVGVGVTPATTLCTVRSAAGTSVQVTEYV